MRFVGCMPIAHTTHDTTFIFYVWFFIKKNHHAVCTLHGCTNSSVRWRCCCRCSLLPQWRAFMPKHLNKYPLDVRCVSSRLLLWSVRVYAFVYDINIKQITFRQNMSECAHSLSSLLASSLHVGFLSCTRTSHRYRVISTILLLLLLLFPFLSHTLPPPLLLLVLFHPSTGNDDTNFYPHSYFCFRWVHNISHTGGRFDLYA